MQVVTTVQLHYVNILKNVLFLVLSSQSQWQLFSPLLCLAILTAMTRSHRGKDTIPCSPLKPPSLRGEQLETSRNCLRSPRSLHYIVKRKRKDVPQYRF